MSDFVIPIANVGILSLCAYMVIQRGWRRVLPLLASYVGAEWLMFLVMLPLAYSRFYPQAFRDPACLACRVYRGTYQVSGTVFCAFLLAVIIELAMHMAGEPPAKRRRFTWTMVATLAALTAGGVVLASQDLPDSSRPVRVFHTAAWICTLGTIAGAFALWRRQRRLRSAVQGNILLMGTAAGFYSLLGIVLPYLFKGGNAAWFDVSNQMSYLVFIVALCVALSRSPAGNPAMLERRPDWIR